MQLYCAPNTISVATALALEEAGLTYEMLRLDMKAKEQTTEAYLAINPKGRVPALVVDGEILTETGALLEYIADTTPKAGLRPADPRQLARMREVMFYLASTMHVNHAHKLRGPRWATSPASFEDMRAKVAENMTENCAYLSAQGLQGPFVLGEHISLADCYLYAICVWLDGDGVVLADFPKIETFMQAMERRNSVKALRAKGLLL